ncbi:MAG: flagellar motor switch protein FliN [Alphaproteobacteria bacterium]|nr:flagellar motor switch protein FliN [Alphaproteobacteria bacterium]
MADTNDTSLDAENGEELSLNELDETTAPKRKASESRFNEEIPEKPKSSAELEAVYDVPVQVSAVLGKSSMQVHQLLKLGRGAVVELDRKIGEAIDIYVNNRLVARGEVVVIEDRLGITMTEIIKAERN